MRLTTCLKTSRRSWARCSLRNDPSAPRLHWPRSKHPHLILISPHTHPQYSGPGPPKGSYPTQRPGSGPYKQLSPLDNKDLGNVLLKVVVVLICVTWDLLVREVNFTVLHPLYIFNASLLLLTNLYFCIQIYFIPKLYRVVFKMNQFFENVELCLLFLDNCI